LPRWKPKGKSRKSKRENHENHENREKRDDFCEIRDNRENVDCANGKKRINPTLLPIFAAEF
jgi:hypothetical protein